MPLRFLLELLDSLSRADFRRERSRYRRRRRWDRAGSAVCGPTIKQFPAVSDRRIAIYVAASSSHP
jgi:hypothetical protein